MSDIACAGAGVNTGTTVVSNGCDDACCFGVTFDVD